MQHPTTSLFTYRATPDPDPPQVTLDMREVVEVRFFSKENVAWYRMRGASEMSRVSGDDASRVYRDYREFNRIVER